MRNELQTYQNNIGFLNSSSKKGNSLVTELNRKVEKLKSDLEVVSKKIKAIDDSIKE
jgi:peptidoglycan hydrolase CwlO-like protein